MATWTTANAELRRKLNDGTTDKLRYFKKLVGQVDGSNTVFKSFEFRRLTDFSASPAAPLGVYVNNALVAVASDSPEVGAVTLAAAPASRSTVEAIYYLQWFTDTELDDFLVDSSRWLGGADDFTNVAIGLRPAALEYAACEAYGKLAAKAAENLSDTYRLEDAPDADKKTPVDYWKSLADGACARAEKLRDDFYSRQGQSNAPLFGVAGRGARRVAPGT